MVEDARQGGVGWLTGVTFQMGCHYTCRTPLYGSAHSHDHQFHLAYLLAGRGTITIDQQRYDVGPACAVFIRPRQVHASMDDNKTDYELIEVKFSVPVREHKRLFPRLQSVVRVHDSAALFATLERLVEAYLIRGADDWLPRVRLAETLILLADEGDLPRVAAPAATDVDRKIRQAVGYMSVHYSDPISVDGLAEYVGMSAAHFAATFKHIMGVSPIEFLIRIRLRRVEDLLTSSTLSVNQIARSCGFNSPQYLARTFARRVGLSPTDYRGRWRS